MTDQPKRSPVVYKMVRDGETVAQVVVLSSGRCIVEWPTSVIVYDSEEDARNVHIGHMGGRGAKTTFDYGLGSAAFIRGWEVCYQDRCEGIPDACGPKAPRYIEESDREDYEAGYLACSRAMYGHDYKPDLSAYQGDRA
jgi:hypothetical protein